LFENIGYPDYLVKVVSELEKTIKFWIREIDQLTVTAKVVENKLELNINFSVG